MRNGLRFLILLVALSVCATAQTHHQCSENLTKLAESVETYAEQNNGRFPLTVAKLRPSVLRTLPRCPVSGQGYTITPTGREFKLYCQGKTHAVEGVPFDHPSFNSRRGLAQFKLSAKPARGKRVDLPGYHFSMPRGWIKETAGERGVVLRHLKDKSQITAGLSQPQPLPDRNHGLWQTGVAYQLEHGGYRVASEEIFERGTLRGYIIGAKRGEVGFATIFGTARNGQFYEFTLEGDYRRHYKSGLSTLRSIAGGLKKSRKR